MKLVGSLEWSVNFQFDVSKAIKFHLLKKVVFILFDVSLICLFLEYNLSLLFSH